LPLPSFSENTEGFVMAWKGLLRSGVALAKSVHQENIKQLKGQLKYKQKIEKKLFFERKRQIAEVYNSGLQDVRRLHLLEMTFSPEACLLLSPEPPDENRKYADHPDLSADLFKIMMGIRPARYSPAASVHPDTLAACWHGLHGLSYRFSQYFSGFHKYIARKTERINGMLWSASATYREAYARFETEYKAVNKLMTFKKWHETFKSDAKVYAHALQELQIFENIQDVCFDFKYDCFAADSISVSYTCIKLSELPSDTMQVLKSGDISVKKQTLSGMNAFYKDFVCSSYLRVARDLFALVPVSNLLIHANTALLNPATGYLESQCILSVRVPRSTFNTLNLQHIDPELALTHFIHNLSVSGPRGLSPVERVTLL